MKIIAFIEKPDVIKKILKHLPPLAHAPPANQLPLYDDASGPSVDDLLVDPQYAVEADFFEDAP